MIKTKDTTLLALIFLVTATLVAQQKASDFNNFNPRFEVFELPGGSLGNSVQGIVQDSTGFVWFASQEGLHRYDGQNFFTYRHDPYNSNSLASDYIEYIFLDSKGIIWLAHYSDGGLTAFDPAKEIFTRYRHDPADAESLGSNTTSVVAEDREGYIWVGGQAGLDRLDPKTGKFKHFGYDPANPRSLSYDQVRALYVDRRGALWVGTGFPFDTRNPGGGLNRYDPKTETFTRYLHDPDDPNSLANNKIRSLLEDSKGNFWVGTGGDGLHLMDREKGTFTRLKYDPANPEKLSAPWVRGTIAATQLPEYHITSIIEDRDGRIWITGFPGGLNVYDPVSGIKRHFEQGKSEGDLSGNHLWQTFQTGDGVTWIATAGAGQKVFKVKKQDERFPFWGWLPADAGFRGDKVSAIAKDHEGNIWIGFSTGTPLVRLDQKTGRILPVQSGNAAAGGFNAREVTSLSLDREGLLWIGTENGLFRRDHPANGREKFRHFLEPVAGNTTSFGTILQDRNGYIWAPSWHAGLYRLDPKTGECTNFRHDPSNPGSIGNGFVWGVYEDEKGNIWVSGGAYNDLAHPLLLDRFNAEKGTFEHFIKEKEAGCATGVAFDGQGNIWFVDNMNNFQKLNPVDGKRRKITPSDGSLYKPANAVISLAQGKDGRFWLYGDNKLFEFDPATEQFYIHGAAHGVSPVGNNRSQLYLARDGRMLIGGERGVLAFDPEKITPAKNSRPPDLRVTAFRLLDERILPADGSLLQKPVWHTTELRMAHDQNVFSFSVACFDFHDPAASQIQFMLEGFDRGWRNDLRDGATPAYVNVSPGKYTFRVRGADSHGVWNMNGASIGITILPPWWQTWWAYSLYALAGIGFLFWLRHLDRKKHNQKLLLEQEKLAQERQVNEQLRRVDALKDQFLANTSHELRTPLQGIIGLSQHLYDEAGRLTPAELRENLAMTISSGKRLNSLVNDILDFSKLKNAEIELYRRPVSLHAMADVVLRNMAALAAAKNLTLINEVPADLTAEADENRLQQILFNLVGNAIKFTEAGHVKVGGLIKVDKIDALQNQPSSTLSTFINIFVEDTGPGIPADKQDAVFQEFVQLEDSATRQSAGTGLGLSVTKRLVELHGGTLWLESEVGKGSTFYFSLPMASGPVESAPEVPALLKNAEAQVSLSSADNGPAPAEDHHSSLIAHRSISILVVDDEPVNQQVLKNHLHTAHYHITPALNGEEALHALESGRTFDLVLLDLMMPRMSGYEVCQKIREKYLPSELPIIMVTAKNQVLDLVQGLDTGANDYLAKPFSKEEFLARVKTQLNLHHINEATSKFVPNEFLRSLGRDNITEVLLGDHVEREVTVLFSDIRDYTTLSESMMPEENFNFVKAFNGRMGPVIQQHKGFVNQYLGDGIMAIFPE
ncbi:MAG TPA: two-component regulator propeller domain-containing protein, partial [Saprospiraceae bacterium]|nr:two-component regulator propeller domain-containing protein [Saprospiraceae bacterium]